MKVNNLSKEELGELIGGNVVHNNENTDLVNHNLTVGCLCCYVSANNNEFKDCSCDSSEQIAK